MQHRLLMTLLSASLISFAATAPLADRAALPSLDRRLVVTSPGGIGIDTGSDVGDLAGFSPIEDGFLEGDNDAGGESDGSDGDGGGGGGSGAPGGGTAVGIANGLTGVGSGSASQNGEGSGSTSNACSECLSILRSLFRVCPGLGRCAGAMSAS